MKIEESDLRSLKALKVILEQSKLELQGAAVKTVASLYLWFDGLEQRMMREINTPPLKPKEKKEVVKKL